MLLLDRIIYIFKYSKYAIVVFFLNIRFFFLNYLNVKGLVCNYVHLRGKYKESRVSFE